MIPFQFQSIGQRSITYEIVNNFGFDRYRNCWAPVRNSGVAAQLAKFEKNEVRFFPPKVSIEKIAKLGWRKLNDRDSLMRRSRAQNDEDEKL